MNTPITMERIVIMIKIITKFICCTLIFGLFGCTPDRIRYTDSHTSDKEEAIDYHTFVVNGQEYSYNSHLMNFLITGVDNQDGEGGQADFILVLSFDRQNKTYQILQLDRSSIVEIRTYDVEKNFLGWNESYLALSYSYGNSIKQSTLYTKDAVSRLLHGIPISYHLTLSLSDLGKIQNVVGEMDVEVKDDLVADVNPEWTKGSIAHITPDNIESFIRYRDVNIDGSNRLRMERQKEYLNTYLDQLRVLCDEDFDGIVDRVSDVAESVYTNVELGEIEDILNMITDYQFREIYQLPGEVVQGKFRTQFNIDRDELEDLIVDLYYVK